MKFCTRLINKKGCESAIQPVTMPQHKNDLNKELVRALNFLHVFTEVLSVKSFYVFLKRFEFLDKCLVPSLTEKSFLTHLFLDNNYL